MQRPNPDKPIDKVMKTLQMIEFDINDIKRDIKMINQQLKLISLKQQAHEIVEVKNEPKKQEDPEPTGWRFFY